MKRSGKVTSVKIVGVLETALYVNDLTAAKAFYRDVLGLEFHAEQEGRHVFFRCGDGMLLLFNPKETSDSEIAFPAHGTTGPGHAAFVLDPDEVDAWRSHFARLGVPIETEVEWPNGGFSIYFRDPSGNSLELATRRVWGK